MCRVVLVMKGIHVFNMVHLNLPFQLLYFAHKQGRSTEFWALAIKYLGGHNFINIC